MKNVILTVIAIVGFLSTVFMVSGCNDAAPAGPCQEQLTEAMQSEDEAWEHVSQIEASIADSAQKQQVIETVKVSEFAKTDWQFRAELCEGEIATARLELEVATNQCLGDYDRNIEFRNALRYFDLTELCDNGTIAKIICDAYFSGNL